MLTKPPYCLKTQNESRAKDLLAKHCLATKKHKSYVLTILKVYIQIYTSQKFLLHKKSLIYVLTNVV